MIRINNLEVGYKEVLLKVNSLQLVSGNVYALVGQNGIGKTTFLKTLNGLIKPIGGTVELEGNFISKLSHSDLAKKIAFVSSRFDGLDHLDVFNYVALGRTPYLGFFGKLSGDDKMKVETILQELELSGLSNKLTSEISDGERQMASIARAIAQETPIITLDEPTAFLDYINKIRFIKQLKKVAEDQQKCVLISTHDLDLCLEEKIKILFIDSNKQLNVFDGADKKDLLKIAFGQLTN